MAGPFTRPVETWPLFGVCGFAIGAMFYFSYRNSFMKPDPSALFFNRPLTALPPANMIKQ